MTDDTSEDSISDYITASPFYRLLQDDVNVMLLDVLLRQHYTTLSEDELARVTGRDVQALTPRLQTLLEINLIDEVDPDDEEEGSASPQYQINKNHKVAKRFGSAQAELFSYGQEL